MRSLISVPDMGAVQTFHPLSYLAPVDSFGAGQRVAPKRESPGDWAAKIGPQDRAIHANGGVLKGGNHGPTKRCPQQSRRGDHATHHIGPGCRERITD
jgi:hypothetical protein